MISKTGFPTFSATKEITLWSKPSEISKCTKPRTIKNKITKRTNERDLKSKIQFCN
jgi:hypothetical protein